MKDLRETLKDFAQISECLDAIEFITSNIELLSTKTIEILQEEIAKRQKDDPLVDIFKHQLRLIEVLRALFEKLKPKPAKEETPSKSDSQESANS